MMDFVEFSVTRVEPVNQTDGQSNQPDIVRVDYTGSFWVSSENIPAGVLNNTALAVIANRAQVVVLHKGQNATAADIQKEIEDIGGKGSKLTVTDLYMYRNGVPVNAITSVPEGSQDAPARQV